MQGHPTGSETPSPGGIPRRGALKVLLLAGWGTFASASLVALAAAFRFLFPNERAATAAVFKAGRPEGLREGDVREEFKRARQVFLVREGGRIFALSATCTHLGCTTNWLSTERKFKCPCHGTGFRPTGENFEGPAPRPLERYRISLDEAGDILVDQGRVFRKERGEWENPESFLRAGPAS